MPNSATLLQALGAAFCAILCALSSLGGGGMMIGVRTAAWAKSGGWVNPYATDGLVAMWDGEWNAGGGKHESNPDTWKDLSGNGNDLTLNQKIEVLENGFVFESRLEFARLDRFLDGNIVEIVCSAPLNAQCVVCQFNYNYGAFIYRNADRGFTFSQSVCANSLADIHNGIAHTFACDYDYEIPIYHVDGEERNYTTGGSWTRDYTRPNYMKIGGLFQQNYNVTLYRIAIYRKNNHDYAANYAIDKARFNLT